MGGSCRGQNETRYTVINAEPCDVGRGQETAGVRSWMNWRLVSAHTVNSWHCISSIFTLDDGFLVLPVPFVKLRVELDGDDLQVTRIVVPGEVTVDTDHIHIRSLETRQTIFKINTNGTYFFVCCKYHRGFTDFYSLLCRNLSIFQDSNVIQY